MITLDALYDYKKKVEHELLMAEAKMSVICDLIADEESKKDSENEQQETEDVSEFTEDTELVTADIQTTY